MSHVQGCCNPSQGESQPWTWEGCQDLSKPHLIETDFMRHKDALLILIPDGVHPKDTKDPPPDILKRHH